MKYYSHLLFEIIILFIILSCGKKAEVAGPIFSNQDSIRTLNEYDKSSCSQFSLVKPTVDFLFLWDNSTSANFINADTKKALQNTLNLVSTRFNYHVVLAPILSSTMNNLYLMVENTEGLSSDATKLIIPNDYVKNLDIFLQIPSVPGSAESGFQRTLDIIGQNQINGIFRKNTHTIVVLISTGDDNTYTKIDNSPTGANNYFNQMTSNFSQLKTTLNAESMRFISIVKNSNNSSTTTTCNNPNFKTGYYYKKMSNQIYDLLPSQYKSTFESAYKDSYDICALQFENIFDGVNQTIQDVLIKHVYNYWPIANTTDPQFNPNKIQVKKNTGQILNENDGNGFKFIGLKENWNTRLLPTPGEPLTGHFIELLGSGQITYPECLIVKTEEPAEFYRYIVLDRKPNLSTLEISINGIKINQNATDGFEYDNYYTSKNIKVKSRTDLTPVEPGIYKSGYFVKLNGSAVLTNNDEVSYSFRPAPIE